MKILWVINKPFPKVSRELGLKVELSQSWLLDLERAVRDAGITLCSACVEHVDDLKCVALDGGNHYVMPMASKFQSAKRYEAYWDQIMAEEQPDIIHVHGTEYRHPLPLLEKYTQVPRMLTIQGVMSRISEQFYGGLSLKEVLRFRTLRENYTLGGMLFTKRLYRKQAKTEAEIVKQVDCVTGRTLWDHSVLKEINPEIRYFRCFYNLREEFYQAEKWNVESMRRHSLYTSFSSYPLKGLHVLLKALTIVKRDYPDVLLNVPGVRGDANGHIVVTSGYTKYLKKLITEWDLTDNVRFLGGQKTEDVIANMQKAHICVVSSAIEGASATLREAMHIGTPCICTYRGGMTELLRDRETGFYYDFPEFSYLAERIMEVFRDDKLAMQFSEKGIESAVVWHDREKNAQDMIDIYNDLTVRRSLCH